MILYVPDFVANAGGVINIALEGTATNEEIMARVDAIGETVGEILRRASTTKLLPNDVAEALARERIAKHQVSSLAA
jgi:leucine dehydrogenase